MEKIIVPKIVSLGMAVPSKSYNQLEVFQACGYPREFKRIFTENEIERRYFEVPMGGQTSWQEMCDIYAKSTLRLSIEAVKVCADGRDLGDVGCIIFVSCTGLTVPSMNYLIAKELNLSPYIEHIPIVGDGGCAGAAPGLRQAANYVKLNPDKRALVVSCEVCSTCFFPEDPKPDPTNKYQLLRANAIFGDGASAVLVGDDNDPRHPYIIDSETYTSYEDQDALGFKWDKGRLSCVLSPDVPKLAGKYLKTCTDRLLKRNKITIEQVRFIIAHPGGKKVLDNIRDDLGLPEEKMSLSREGMRNFGNCSSASVGMLSKLFMDKEVDVPRLGDYGIILTVGSGLNANAILLRWGR